MHFRRDDLKGPEIKALLEEHLAHMHSQGPPESVHALDLERLRQPDIRFWTAWSGDGELMACGALKALSAEHEELKSMRTTQAFRGKGAGRAMLNHLLADARSRGVQRLSLETGTQPGFEPARSLYRSAGFGPTGPIEGYVDDPLITFMTRLL